MTPENITYAEVLLKNLFIHNFYVITFVERRPLCQGFINRVRFSFVASRGVATKLLYNIITEAHCPGIRSLCFDLHLEWDNLYKIRPTTET